MVKLCLRPKSHEYLDGSRQAGSGLAQVQQSSDGDPVGQVVDEGHVVDQIVRLSNTQDEYCGDALWDMQAGKSKSM